MITVLEQRFMERVPGLLHDLTEDELKGELHRLKGIVLQQAFDRYMYLNYK